MKKFYRSLSYYIVCISALLLTSFAQLKAEIRFTSNDPFPLYTAQNPLAMFTFWQDCEPEQTFAFSVSFFRQNADKGKNGPFFLGSCPTGACSGCQQCCNTDVEIGDIHGPWNMIALLYDEEDCNCLVRNTLIRNLNLLDSALFPDGCSCLTRPSLTSSAALVQPAFTDTKKRFGFFSVPIEYRKYGIRFELDYGTCWDIGLRIQGGVATIRQDAIFNDLTCQATGDACGPNCSINVFDCTCRHLVVEGIMSQNQRDIIADTLGLDLDNFCETDVENLNIALYWRRCYDVNKGTDNPCWPEFTFVPYFIGEVSVPINKTKDPNQLFAVPFGNNNHWGFGFTGGFNINFLETVQIGLEAGFARFSRECYPNSPVPTNDLQQGIYPRKADLSIRPATTWSFAATLNAHHFLSCLSFYGQFRLLHKCDDHICVLRTIPFTPPILCDTIPVSDEDCPDLLCDNTSPNMPVSNIKLKKMEEETRWVSSFFDISFDYDLSDDLALGFAWQAPVSQEFAYRPTTVMASLIVKF